jgi:hypothetical protein
MKTTLLYTTVVATLAYPLSSAMARDYTPAEMVEGCRTAVQQESPGFIAYYDQVAHQYASYGTQYATVLFQGCMRLWEQDQINGYPNGQPGTDRPRRPSRQS